MRPLTPIFLSSLFPEKEVSQYDDDIQSESPLSASSPPADWKRTSKDYLKIAIIVITVLMEVDEYFESGIMSEIQGEWKF